MDVQAAAGAVVVESTRLNFLVVGGGAREHSIAFKLSQSHLLNDLFLADPNDGFCDLGNVLTYSDFDDLAKQAAENNIDITVVGGEATLAQGIVDIFNKYGLAVIGTDLFWTQLESSKIFAKKFMKKHSIRAADYVVLDNSSDLEAVAQKNTYVIKADGLCAGKGVFITDDRTIAVDKMKNYIGGEFGDASKTVLLEEFLEGEEFSLICLFDGETLLPFVPARDFKKLYNSKSAPNTGGMGAFCPVVLNDNQRHKLELYRVQLQKALIEEGATFCGFIYCGLIWSGDDFYTLEFNTRLGDPEAQAILSHLDYDFGLLLQQATKKELASAALSWKSDVTGCLVLACNGYPTLPLLGDNVFIPSDLGADVFFAGVKKHKDKFVTSSGRVLSLVCNSKSPFDSLYKAAGQVDFKHKYFRSDITCD